MQALLARQARGEPMGSLALQQHAGAHHMAQEGVQMELAWVLQDRAAGALDKLIAVLVRARLLLAVAAASPKVYSRAFAVAAC